MTNGKCIAVSDVHLGIDYSNRDRFVDFIDNLGDDVDRLVLIGDILEFWRRDPVGVLLENTDIIQKLISLEPEINVSYVVGNHDYHLIRFPQSYFGAKFDLKRDLSLGYGGIKYRFIHGYQLENKQFGTLETYETFADALCMSGDDVGKAADMIWKKIGKGGGILDMIRNFLGISIYSSNTRPKATLPWIKEKIGEILLEPEERNMEKYEEYAIELVNEKYKGEFLIYGHSHEPYVKTEKNLANTGSWVRGSSDYLEIDKHGVALKSY
ncbi:MAG: UDP-2,3-diacylglucosamine pyrophosphatase LpxH [Candidatus Methanomarinus sp.]|nr:UDP-2,3-diacylglucosamine pyrophosphatase LpxH [ANME-2 cluster archaeon]KAF5428221.1 MAG: UDP-2,3-diacylglucosamine pyrophosphatase LpxH [ANME-2 cluster archaeon]